MDPRVRIEPLSRGHAEGFHGLVDAVAREERYLAMRRAYPLPDVRDYVAECVEKKRPAFVALEAGMVVGWCDIVEKPRELLAHSGVLGMGVAAAHRGRRIGASLLERTLADARSKGFTRVELTVRADNERARRLYEKLGFSVEGVMRRHMRVRGDYHDSYLMAVLYD